MLVIYGLLQGDTLSDEENSHNYVKKLSLWLKPLSHYVVHANCRMYFESNRKMNYVLQVTNPKRPFKWLQILISQALPITH